MTGQKQIYTLCFLKRGEEVLLGLKTRGLGKGLWNGFGGKIEGDETTVECVKREIEEECGVRVENPNYIGFVAYETEGQSCVEIVHVFTATEFGGSPVASEEMNPVRWYHCERLPTERMYGDFAFWKHHMLAERFFCGRVKYSRGRKEIVGKAIEEFDSVSDVCRCLEQIAVIHQN